MREFSLFKNFLFPYQSVHPSFTFISYLFLPIKPPPPATTMRMSKTSFFFLMTFLSPLAIFSSLSLHSVRWIDRKYIENGLYAFKGERREKFPFLNQLFFGCLLALANQIKLIISFPDFRNSHHVFLLSLYSTNHLHSPFSHKIIAIGNSNRNWHHQRCRMKMIKR